MQHKMRENPLAPEGVNRLLESAMVGRVSTNGSDGYPYTVAVHVVYREGAVYFHGLPKGEKPVSYTHLDVYKRQALSEDTQPIQFTSTGN